MPELVAIELKAHIPARDFEVSKQFYQDIGFTLCSSNGGLALLHYGPGHGGVVLRHRCHARTASKILSVIDLVPRRRDHVRHRVFRADALRTFHRWT